MLLYSLVQALVVLEKVILGYPMQTPEKYRDCYRTYRKLFGGLVITFLKKIRWIFVDQGYGRVDVLLK